MPDFTFDGDAKIITEPAGSGDTEYSVARDLYSAAKRWLADGDNTKYPLPISVVGGDPITPSQNLGATFFLENGWRIRPAERSHKVTLVGNLFTREPGESVFVATLGAFTVNTETRVSSLVDSSIARLDLTQLLNSVYIDVENGVSGTGAGVGTPTNPVDNIADARTIADRDKIRSYHINGDLELDQAHVRWTFIGLASGRSSRIDLNGQNVDESAFQNLVLTGYTAGDFKAQDCGLDLFSEISGVFSGCGFIGNISIREGGSATFANCHSEIPGSQAPICMLGGTNLVSFRNYSGGIEIRGSVADCVVSLDLDPGSVVLHESNVAGQILVRGTGHLENNAPGVSLNTVALIDASDQQLTDTRVEEIHRFRGLKEGVPLRVTPDGESAGDVELTIEGDGQTELTLTRNASE